MQIERIGIDFGTSNTAASIRGKRDGQGLHEIIPLDAEREALATRRFKEAIALAGFKNFDLLEEPTAASRAAFRADTQRSGSVDALTLVADLGGGTSDFTLLRTHKNSEKPEVLSVHGVPLAGDALDSAFVQTKLLRYFGSEVKYQRPFSSNILTFPTALISRIPKWHQHVLLKEKSNWNFLLDLRKELVNPDDRGALENIITLVEENLGYQLHKSVEDLKVRLSGGDATVEPFTFRSYPIDLHFPVTLPEYEAVIAPVVERIRQTALRCLELAKVTPDSLTRLSFTGGTARVPALRRVISSLVPQARIEDQDSFTAVALGLSLE